jgi:hypothetical protein
MKKKGFTIFFYFLFIFANAQIIQNRTGYKFKTDISPLENGKYSYLSAVCRDTSAKIIIMRPESATGSGNPGLPGRSQAKSLPIYHVVFHFDQGPWDVMCNGTDTMFNVFNMNWINNYTVEAYMPEGYYDILSSFFDAAIEPAYVFAKNFHVNMNRDTTILFTSANHQVTIIGIDENWNLLPDNEKSGDQLGVLIEFPDSFNCPLVGGSFGGWPTDHVKFSDVRPDIKIYLGETAMVKYKQYHRYEIAYPALMGITHDTTLTFYPINYRQYSLIYNSSPTVTQPFFVYSYGNMNNCLLGPLDYMLFSFGVADTPSEVVDTVKFFSSNMAVDTNKYLFCYGLSHCEDRPSAWPGFNRHINDWLYYSTPYSTLVLAALGKYPPVVGDYEVPEGSTAHVGNNAPFNIVYANNSPVNLEIRVSSFFTGQSNERRGVDDYYGTYDIWKGEQHLYHDSLHNGAVIWGATVPGIYSVVLNDSNYMINGKAGYLQAKVTFDIGNEDPNPPRLRAMQILMGDSIAPTVVRGFSSSVRFTAGDWISVPNVYFKVYHQLREVHLSVKNYTDTAWQELVVQSHPENLDSILGMPYTADLEQVLSQYPDSAWVDLKIELTDSAGNSNVQIIHPAFLVRDVMTRIKPVKRDPKVIIYPNPASDKITIDTAEEDVCVTIYTITGQPVTEVFNRKEIDISLLKSGLYIVRIKNTINGRITFAKFIK